MIDVFGNKLNIGDEVAFVSGKNKDAKLDKGKITKFYKGYFNRDECSVDNNPHILSWRIAKISKLKGE